MQVSGKYCAIGTSTTWATMATLLNEEHTSWYSRIGKFRGLFGIREKKFNMVVHGSACVVSQTNPTATLRYETSDWKIRKCFRVLLFLFCKNLFCNYSILRVATAIYVT